MSPAGELELIRAPFFHTPANAFTDDKDQVSLRTARFFKFVQAIVPEGKARTVLTFMPEVANREKVKLEEKLPINAPALVEWNPPLIRAQQPGAEPGKKGVRDRHLARYRGKVVLFTSTVNMDWTTWPGSVVSSATGTLRRVAAAVSSMARASAPSRRIVS